MKIAAVFFVMAVCVPCPVLWAQTPDPLSRSRAPDAVTPSSGDTGTGADEDDAAAEKPVLRVDFPETEAIPGQFLTLRLTVLVPSFMPAPPVWPSFEAPNLLVRVPEGGTSPVSERIDGKTWSGVSRRYLIAPMVPGAFEMPPQEVLVTWAGRSADEPARIVVSTEVLAFSGVLPDGAENLDPFIAATDLTVTQEITGDPGAMVPGESITRAITVEVGGVSPIFLPGLLVPVEVSGVAAYPDKPILKETDNRGVLGGTRRESVSYIAENGGGGTLPSVELQWYDIDTGTIETARAEAVRISIEGPPAALADLEAIRRTFLLAAAGVAFVVLLALGLRAALPFLRRRTAARRDAWRASEGHAWHVLMRAVAARDRAALHPALDTWATRVKGENPRLDPEVLTALTTLGRTRYGSDRGSTSQLHNAWHKLGMALRSARKKPSSHAARGALPPLNPGASA